MLKVIGGIQLCTIGHRGLDGSMPHIHALVWVSGGPGEIGQARGHDLRDVIPCCARSEIVTMHDGQSSRGHFGYRAKKRRIEGAQAKNCKIQIYPLHYLAVLLYRLA